MGKVIVVVGGQFGSEGKGAVCAHLARQIPAEELVSVRVGGPNAGHTFWQDGQEVKLQQVPVGWVAQPGSQGYIAAGSEIDHNLIRQEVVQWESGRPRLYIDQEATILDPSYSDTEREGKEHGEAGLTKRIGSTGKGVGEARAARAQRVATRFGDRYHSCDVSSHLRQHLVSGRTILVEGVQGYGLGLHAGFYPFCTSIDCRAVDMLALAGLSPWNDYITILEIWVVFRLHPIRVAGNSGPMLRETSWEALGQPPQLTTVTRKPRRVGRWDTLLAVQAVLNNGYPSDHQHIALTHWDWRTDQDPTLDEIERQVGPVELLGVGPDKMEVRK